MKEADVNNDRQQLLQNAQNLILQGQNPRAEKLLRDYLVENPNDENAICFLGHSLMRQQKTEDAKQAFKKATKLNPNSAPAFANLGFALEKLGYKKEAIEAYRKTVFLNERMSEIWHFLATLLMDEGDKQEAIKCFRKSRATDPYQPQIKEIFEAMSRENFDVVENICRKVLQHHKSHPQALTALTQLAIQVYRFEDAAKMLEQGLEYDPYNLDFWNKLSFVLSKLGRAKDRLVVADRVTQLMPKEMKAWFIMGQAQFGACHYDKALEAYDTLLKIDPENIDAELQRGHMLKILGRRQECEQSYRNSIKMTNTNGAAYWGLADLKDFDFKGEDIRDMEAIVADKAALIGHVALAGFALAKAYEDRGEYDISFKNYEMANGIRPDVDFNLEEFKSLCENIKTGFSCENLNVRAEIASNGPKPIFIVGLPRSGSTLLEQILSSHSQVEGTMELKSLLQVKNEITIKDQDSTEKSPDNISNLTPDELAGYGKSYMDKTEIYRTDKPYFIDKLPTNFRLAGLIHKILPDAIIIDARRHPLDSGFSSFKQHFGSGYDFSYNLEHIGHYYNCYLDLMDYWDEMLPNKVLCVQYEEMVMDTENQVRRMLDHCGLPFEDNCLDFYKNIRAVSTASSEQVRQPIYTKSVAHWRNFEKHLQPLINALGKETLARFEN